MKSSSFWTQVAGITNLVAALLVLVVGSFVVWVATVVVAMTVPEGVPSPTEDWPLSGTGLLLLTLAISTAYVVLGTAILKQRRWGYIGSAVLSGALLLGSLVDVLVSLLSPLEWPAIVVLAAEIVVLLALWQGYHSFSRANHT
jgi:hypothetical protein